jgi:hypothetical protein
VILYFVLFGMWVTVVTIILNKFLVQTQAAEYHEPMRYVNFADLECFWRVSFGLLSIRNVDLHVCGTKRPVRVFVT